MGEHSKTDMLRIRVTEDERHAGRRSRSRWSADRDMDTRDSTHRSRRAGRQAGEEEEREEVAGACLLSLSSV